MQKTSSEIILEQCNVDVKKPKRIYLPLKSKLTMIFNYALAKMSEQFKSVLFIILYLPAFQIFVLNTLPENAICTSIGVGMVILGLAIFVEGLFLGVMPLGDRVGVQLPQKTNLFVTVFLGFLLGIASTFSEPSIVTLRIAGGGVTPWEAPLLYRLLETDSELLILSVGVGVGVAVAMSILRIFLGFSIRLFLFIIAPFSLLLTALCSLDPNMRSIIGLAWDTGAVTTGAVAVPLILALGIGISRATKKRDTATSGFGSVAFAAIFPLMIVMSLGFILNKSTPLPMPEKDFFSAANRKKVIEFVGDEERLLKLAFQRGSVQARKAMFATPEDYKNAVLSLANPTDKKNLLESESLFDWLENKASKEERKLVLANLPADLSEQKPTPILANIFSVFKEEMEQSLKSVLSLVFLLFFVLVIIKEKPRYLNEILLGLVFAIVGMAILTSGIRLGLTPLGNQAGRPLPKLFKNELHETRPVVIEDFDESALISAYDKNGALARYFYIKNPNNSFSLVEYKDLAHNKNTKIYTHTFDKKITFIARLTLFGVFIVLLFAFGLGFGSTMAEPALAALGRTVEELTVGTVKATGLIKAVAIGVGIGLIVGVSRILYGLDTFWFIIVTYTILIIGTYFTKEDFIGIAWDCGGVTTGIITVPLVLAMGLGISSEANIADGFAVISMALVCTIISVIIYGLKVNAEQQLTDSQPMETEDANQ